jgi:hypothetical protein
VGHIEVYRFVAVFCINRWFPLDPESEENRLGGDSQISAQDFSQNTMRSDIVDPITVEMKTLSLMSLFLIKRAEQPSCY